MEQTVSTSSLFSWVILAIDDSMAASSTLPVLLHRSMKGQDGAEVQEYGLCRQRNWCRAVALLLMTQMTLGKL